MAEVESSSTLVHVVAVALVAPDHRVLLQKRPIRAQHGGLWEFPGGKVEPGENPDSAVIREIAEELDLALDAGDLVEVARAGPVPGASPPVVITLYSCRRWTGEPRCLVGEAIDWFAIPDVPGLEMPPLDYPLAEALILSI